MSAVEELVQAQNIIRKHGAFMPSFVARVIADINVLITEASRLQQEQSQ